MQYCHIDDAYDNFNKAGHDNVVAWPHIIDAQGDMNGSGPYHGTKIKDLPGDDDHFTEMSSELHTDDVRQVKQLDHKYCIDRFIAIMGEYNDLMSVGSTDGISGGEVFNHVKRCKYCKKEIGKHMKRIHGGGAPVKGIETFLPKIDNIGYDLKEIGIVIVAGIVLILIMWLIVGRR